MRSVVSPARIRLSRVTQGFEELLLRIREHSRGHALTCLRCTEYAKRLFLLPASQLERGSP